MSVHAIQPMLGSGRAFTNFRDYCSDGRLRALEALQLAHVPAVQLHFCSVNLLTGRMEASSDRRVCVAVVGGRWIRAFLLAWLTVGAWGIQHVLEVHT